MLQLELQLQLEPLLGRSRLQAVAQTIVLMTKTFGWQGSHYWWLSVAKLERGQSMRLVRVIRWPGI